MTNIADYLLDHSSAALLVFMAAAALSWIVRIGTFARVMIGLAAIGVAMILPISTRTGFDWIVAAIERPSAPGLLLLVICAISAVTGRRFDDRAEYRFGTAILALAGLVLYPAAVGFLNYDTYTLGYSGYLLPLIVCAVLAYAVYRQYFFVVAAVNVAILAFLLGTGRSLNLWDYIVDPVAWLFAIGSWITILVGISFRKSRQAPEAPA